MTYAYDPELQPLVDLLPESDISDLAGARAMLDSLLEGFGGDVDLAGLVVTEVEVPGPSGAPPVPVHLYVPEGEAPAGGRAAVLDIHGGGFVMGSAVMERAFASDVARRMGVVVAVVEYRLAPEHPYPAGIEDCYAALTWLHAEADDLGIDVGRVAVAGQSAGGGLAAGLALLARDRGGPPICFQLLGIPELDHRLETTSMRTFVDTPLWHRANAELSWSHYLGPDPGEVAPYASPAVAEDLSGLPPAYIATMEFDPLRDEGITYALRLMGAGVSVELHSYPGTFHGSSVATTAAVSQRAHQELADALARGLGCDLP
jgi:acetyl esterase/lipase